MRRYCRSCPKRENCQSICPELEDILPPADGSTRAELKVLDREIVWSIQDREHILTRKQQPVARLYYRFGLSEEEVARRVGVSRQAVSRMLARIRKKLRLGVAKTSLGEGR